MAETKIKITAVDKTRAAFQSVNSGVSKLDKSLSKLSGGLAAVAGGAAMGAFIKSSLNAADALAKQADKLGLTTEALAGLHQAAKLSGVTTQTMDMALQRMTRRLSEAAAGTGEAQKAIQELGLDAGKLASMAPDQSFREITKAMEGVANQGDKVRLAMRFFDSEGVSLVNTMQGGTKALDAAAEATRKYGTALNRADAGQLEKTNDALSNVMESAKGLGFAISLTLAPAIQDVSYFFSDILIPTLTSVFTWFRKIGVALGGVAASFVAFATGDFKEAAGIMEQVWIDLTTKIESTPIKPKIVAASGGTGLPIDNEKFASEIEQRYLMLDQALLTEQERIQMDYEQKLMALEEYALLKDMSDAQWAEKEVQLESWKQNKLNAIKEKSRQKDKKAQMLMYTGLAGATAGLLNTMAGMQDSHTKSGFKKQKKYSKASAVINTAMAITSALGTQPFIVGLVLAAVAAASGIAQINKINSTSFEGGGSAPSAPSGSIGSAPSIPTQAPPQVPGGAEPSQRRFIDVRFQGEGAFTELMAQQMAPVLEEMAADGATTINISRT